MEAVRRRATLPGGCALPVGHRDEEGVLAGDVQVDPVASRLQIRQGCEPPVGRRAEGGVELSTPRSNARRRASVVGRGGRSRRVEPVNADGPDCEAGAVEAPVRSDGTGHPCPVERIISFKHRPHSPGST